MESNGVGFASDGKYEGVGTFEGGVYRELKISGVCTVNGDIEAESVKIDGVCTFNGNIEAESLRIDGVCDCRESISAKTFDCDGVLTIYGNLRAGVADIDGVVSVRGDKVEADRIKCDGVLSVEGEISADVIEADGQLNAEEIVGDHIVIKSYWRGGIKRLLFKLGEKIGDRWNIKYSVIGLIEGTTVELRSVHARSVNGHDVHIGKHCEIDRVEASGELTIHPSASVGEVAGPQ